MVSKLVAFILVEQLLFLMHVAMCNHNNIIIFIFLYFIHFGKFYNEY